MDLDEIEGLNEVRPAVYRAALKLRSLQKLCQMHLISLRDLRPVLRAVGGLGDPTVSLSQQNLRQSLEQLFQSVLQELPDQALSEATEQTARLLFKLYDREETGYVLLRSIEAALVVLSGDTLSAKHRALFQLAVSCSERQGTKSISISHSGLRVLLTDLSQVPAVVQENHVFGQVDTAAHSCFNGVDSVSVGEENFLTWLQSEPRLLLWLSTLYRLSVSEAVLHRVRCHACKAFPITGLRYRCLKCLNVHLCQNCFLTETRTRKHKPSHPVLEYCTQPSWKESMASLASSARHALLPRRYTRRETGRRIVLRSESNTEPQYSASVPVQQQQQQQEKCVDGPGGFPAPLPPDSSPLQRKVESKALQTDNPDTQPQRKTSLLQKDICITQKAMRDLQRDKWLLEREFQVWKVAAQSEHDCLEDRCAELEATMEVLSHHNQQLEEELSQIRHTLTTRGKDHFGSVIQQPLNTPPSQQNNSDNMAEKLASKSTDSHSAPITENVEPEREKEEEEKEERVKEKGEEEDSAFNQVQEEAHMDSAVMDSLLIQTEENVQLAGEPEEEALEEEEEDEELQLEREEIIIEDSSSVGSAQEDFWTENSNEEEEEEELCGLVQRLKGALLIATTTVSGAHQREALLLAAGAVGDSVSHLVTSVKSFT